MFLILVALALRAERRRSTPRRLAAIWRGCGPRRRRRDGGRGRPRGVRRAFRRFGRCDGQRLLGAAPLPGLRSHASRPSVGETIRSHRARAGAVQCHGARPTSLRFVPYNSYDELLPDDRRPGPLQRMATPMYVVGETGSLIPVRFTTPDPGIVSRATIEQREAAARTRGDARRLGLRPIQRSELRCCASRCDTRCDWRRPADSSRRRLESRCARRCRRASQCSPRARVRLAGNGGFPPDFARGTSGQYFPLQLNIEASRDRSTASRRSVRGLSC